MIELRRAIGRADFTGNSVESSYDTIVLDGVDIGCSMIGSNLIQWRPYRKSEIPLSVRKEAVRLCRRRNELQRGN